MKKFVNDEKDIAIIIPHKGIGDIIFHYNFILSIFNKYQKKLIIVCNKSTNFHYIYKNNKIIKKIIYLNLKRPKNYFAEVLRLFKALFQYRFSKIYYTGSNNWHLIVFYLLRLFRNTNFYYFVKKKKYIIDQLDYFLKRRKIKNLKNYNLKIFGVKKNAANSKAVFLSFHTSENQLKINDKKVIKLLCQLNKNYRKIYINDEINRRLIPQQIKKKIIFTRKYNILKISKIINKCKLFICSESGPAIIAKILKKKGYIITNNFILRESKLITNINKKIKYITTKDLEKKFVQFR